MQISREPVEVPLEPLIYESTDLTDLNELLKQVLQPLSGNGRNEDLVFRCSQLPFTRGDAAVFKEVFRELLRMIMARNSGRKFLHISCEEKKPSRGGEGQYEICFHTNFATDSNWIRLFGETILDCQARLRACKAFLQVNEISASGCLFSISLQGKIF